MSRRHDAMACACAPRGGGGRAGLAAARLLSQNSQGLLGASEQLLRLQPARARGRSAKLRLESRGEARCASSDEQGAHCMMATTIGAATRASARTRPYMYVRACMHSRIVRAIAAT